MDYISKIFLTNSVLGMNFSQHFARCYVYSLNHIPIGQTGRPHAKCAEWLHRLKVAKSKVLPFCDVPVQWV